MEMHDLCAIAARETRCVLATAIKVEGHAYRKQGVSMLLTEDGKMVGSISPGCLESDLQARVSHVLDTKQMEFAEYDMRPEDDLSWGETIGCGGLVVVLLEPVCGELQHTLQKMQECFQSGVATALTRTFQDDYTRVQYGWRRIEPAGTGRQPILRPSLVPPHDRVADYNPASLQVNVQHSSGNTKHEHTGSTQHSPDIPHLMLVPEVVPATSNGTHSSHLSGDSQHISDTDAEIPTNDGGSTNPWDLPRQLTSLYTPKPRLIIIGAGNDVIPVARLAWSAGFRVVVADWRESLCTSDRFPETELVLGFPREIMPLLKVNSGDYLILMSHNFPRERELLEMVVDCEYAYLGIMGSKTRTARLLDGLPPLKYVHSPVGLSIGADGPEQIAISIVAELIACKHKVSSLSSEFGQKGSVAHANDGHSSGSR
ncbi:XdhC family protein [Paenibacillus sp. FSL H7-689]|uniref:XdhC family protein n=1 Tax=Paenibacillus sp. FSL H7-689 TaxID=1227349 RepID=UPI0003E2A871|nr:XdhC/CoxI family protein [Paenibacillus sp. FSL H7-689]ETT47754.1 xanthine dehydrogenase [Paenibacillus sp. FSL H7-689]